MAKQLTRRRLHLYARKGFYAAIFCLFAFWTCTIGSQDKILKADTPAPSGGERLIYAVKWDPPWYLFFLPSMEAGELDIHSAGLEQFKGRPAYKIIIHVRSSGTLSKMAGIKVEDEFVYYTDPSTLCTQGASGKIREGKRKRQQDLEYTAKEHSLHFTEMDEAAIPPKLKKDSIKFNIPACVQDPISALYSYRGSPFEIGLVRTFTIGNDDKIKDVRTYVESKVLVNTPAGKFQCWKVRADALKDGLFKEGGQFRIWISADERKAPVQFEAKVSLGRVLGVLKSANP
jgi:hypothetical protein